MKIPSMKKLPAVGCLLASVLSLALVSAVYVRAEDSTYYTDPLAGIYEHASISPKQRLIVSYLNKDGSMRSYEVSGKNAADPGTVPERVTKLTDFGSLTQSDTCHVFSSAAAQGNILSTVHLQEPFAGATEIPNVPQGVQVNTYFVMENRNSKRTTTSAWIEMTNGDGRIGRMKITEFTPAYTVAWRGDKKRRHDPLIGSNINHDLIAYDWNGDGYSDYLLTFITATDNDGQNAKVRLAVIDGKGLYEYLTGSSQTRPSVTFLNGEKDTPFLTGDSKNLVGGGTFRKPPHSCRTAIGDFDGDGRAEIAVYFTKIRGGNITEALDNHLVVYKLDKNFSATKIYEIDGKPCGRWFLQGDSVGLAAGNLDGNTSGKDQLILLYARSSQNQKHTAINMSILSYQKYDAKNPDKTFSATVSEKELRGGFSPLHNMTGGARDTVSPLEVQIGDFDADGYKELAFTFADSGSERCKLTLNIFKWSDPTGNLDVNTGTLCAYNLNDNGIVMGTNGNAHHSFAAGRYSYAGTAASGGATVMDQLGVVAAAWSTYESQQLCSGIFTWNKTDGLARKAFKIDKDMHGTYYCVPRAAAADVHKESMVLGTPLAIAVTDRVDLYSAIQAPPRHWDAVSADESSTLSRDENGNAIADVFYRLSGYSTKIDTSKSSSSMVTKSDTHEGSAGITTGMKVGQFNVNGSKADPNFAWSLSVANEHAKTKTSKKSFSVEMNTSATAALDDQLYANTCDATVWRYPVIWPEDLRMSAISDDKGNNVKTQNFIQYVVPERVGGNLFPVSGRNASWYNPNHDNRNLFTYPRQLKQTKGYPGTMKDVWGDEPEDLTGLLLAEQDAVYFGNVDAASAACSINTAQHKEAMEKNKLSVTTSVYGGGDIKPKAVPIYVTIYAQLDGNYAWTHSCTTTSDISNTSGVSIHWPGAAGYVSKSGIAPEQLGFKGDFGIYTQDDGVLCASYAVRLLKDDNSGSLLWGPSSPYRKKADPALNLPNRWYSDGTRNTLRSGGYVRGLTFAVKNEAGVKIERSYSNTGTLLPTNAKIVGKLRVFNLSFKEAANVTLKVYREPTASVSGVVSDPDLSRAELINTVNIPSIPGRDSYDESGYLDNWTDREFEFKTSGEEKAYWLHFKLESAGEELSGDNNYGYIMIATQNEGEGTKKFAAELVDPDKLPDLALSGVTVRECDGDKPGLETTLAEQIPLAGKSFNVSGHAAFTAGHVGTTKCDIIHGVTVNVVADGSVIGSDFVPGIEDAYNFSLNFAIPEGYKTPKEIKLVALSSQIPSAYDKDPENNGVILYSSGGSSGGCSAAGFPALAALLATATMVLPRRKGR